MTVFASAFNPRRYGEGKPGTVPGRKEGFHAADREKHSSEILSVRGSIRKVG